jgi:hypothetical protein
VTLQECFDRHHAAQPVEIRPVLTPRGVACVQVVRLEQALADLSSADRAHVLGRLRALLDDTAATH